jgi:hypothetical protein
MNIAKKKQTIRKICFMQKKEEKIRIKSQSHAMNDMRTRNLQGIKINYCLEAVQSRNRFSLTYQ